MYKKNLFKKTLVIGIFILFVGVVIAPTISSFDNQLINKNPNTERVSFNPFLEGWEYRKMITINHTQVAGNLINFPVSIRTIDPDLRNNAQIDGDDILFMDDKGVANQLYHEIEYYDGSIGELVAWVNIPALSTAVDVIIYMYYGNTQCTNQEFPELVWDSNYIHVWHLGNTLKDSAGTDDGTNHGTDIVSGKIGKARDFEQNEGDFIDLGDMLQPADGSLTTITFEAWIKPETQDMPLLSKYNSQGSDYSAYLINFVQGGKFRATAASSFGVKTESITVNSYSVIGQWVHLTATYNLGGVNNIVPFIDGNEVPDTQPSSNGDYMRNIPVTDDIGRYRPENDTQYTDAVIDEVRWSKTVRSDAWIKTSYNTMNDPESFLNIGPEGTNLPPIKPDINGSNVGMPEISYSFTFTSIDPENDDIAEYIINWGDGPDVTITGPFPSGFSVPASHIWATKGTYIIYAKAKDIIGAESDWATFQVKMPRNKASTYSLILHFLEQFPILERFLYLID